MSPDGWLPPLVLLNDHQGDWETYKAVLYGHFCDDFVARATASSQGTKMPRANWDVMRRYPVVAPDASLLRRFNSVAAPAADLAAALGLATRALATTRDLLLPGLISGEVSVREGAR